MTDITVPLPFWEVTSFAISVGLVTAYPTDRWLVSEGLKHGLATVRARGDGKRHAEGWHA